MSSGVDLLTLHGFQRGCCELFTSRSHVRLFDSRSAFVGAHHRVAPLQTSQGLRRWRKYHSRQARCCSRCWQLRTIQSSDDPSHYRSSRVGFGASQSLSSLQNSFRIAGSGSSSTSQVSSMRRVARDIGSYDGHVAWPLALNAVISSANRVAMTCFPT